MADFDTERAAFFAGFGDGTALIAGLRSAELVVPLDVDGNIFTWVWGDLPWLAVFTDVGRCATFAEAAGRDLDAIEICALRGAVVLDELLDKAPTATGLVGSRCRQRGCDGLSAGAVFDAASICRC
ncbi:SseB family protein [Mycobacterium sp. MUNTM1]